MFEYKERVEYSAILSLLLVLFLSFSSCYEPEEYVPPVYLEPEVNLVVDNVPWDSTSNEGSTLNFQNREFDIFALNEKINAWLYCRLMAKGNAESVDVFNTYSNDTEIVPFKLGSFRTNDTIAVTMYYRIYGIGDDSDGFPDFDYWDSSDPELNILTIEDSFIYENQIYVSGKFDARVRFSYDGQFPWYRYIEGTFKNVRVTKAYPKVE